MPAITPGTPLHSFVQVFSKSIGEVLSQSLASPWTVQLDAQGMAAPDEPPLFFQVAASGGLQGSAALQLQAAQAVQMAQRFLGETPAPAEPSATHKEALEELLRQIAGLAATELKSLFGEVKLEVTSVDAPAWQGVTVVLLASESSAAPVQLQFLLSSELLASISSTPAAIPAVAAKPADPGKDAANAPNFDLLLGVNLNLTLRFGQRVLSLRELLDLSSGAVIELDREVNEPADLLLGNKVIARGEVVIVDGNYGLRVTEVADARQRLERI